MAGDELVTQEQECQQVPSAYGEEHRLDGPGRNIAQGQTFTERLQHGVDHHRNPNDCDVIDKFEENAGCDPSFAYRRLRKEIVSVDNRLEKHDR